MTEDKDLLWKQYELSVGLMKSYLELVLKLNVFFYAVTGAIVSYCLANVEEVPLTRWSLILPLVMSFAFAVLYGYGAIRSNDLRKEIHRLNKAMGFDVGPEGSVLTAFLVISAGLLTIVALALGGLLCYLGRYL